MAAKLGMGAMGLADRLEGVIETIDAAGLGLATWTNALKQARDLTGSRVAQLIGIGKAADYPLGWTTEPADEREFVEAGGLDLRVNHRRRISLAVPNLVVCEEPSFGTESSSVKHPAWEEFLRRNDYPYVCFTPVARSFDLTITFSVSRGVLGGGLDSENKRLFVAMAARVRHAVRTQDVLQARSLELVIATFDQMSQSVFACSRDGKVLACTPSGESLLAAGDRLMLTSGRLNARSRPAAGWLLKSIARACDDAKAVAVSPGIVYDAQGERPLVLEMVPIPDMASDFFGSPAVLVVARELDATRAAGRLARMGAATMGFTPAEEAVARDLLAGRSPRETAEALGIAVGTVRIHVRNIYAKAGTSNQLGFAALMGALR